jgi:hypothetical protein
MLVLSPTHACHGRFVVDFFVTSLPGAFSSHETATNLVWDWQDAHAGSSDVYDPDSQQTLTWPRVDRAGHSVRAGIYWLHIVVSPSGFLRPLDMEWDLT